MKKETLELGNRIYKLSEKIKEQLPEFGFVRFNLNGNNEFFDFQFVLSLYTEEQTKANESIQNRLSGVTNILNLYLSELKDESYTEVLTQFELMVSFFEEKEKEEPDPTYEPVNKCPFGHIYGINNDDTDDCDSCNVWSDCYESKKNKNK